MNNLVRLLFAALTISAASSSFARLEFDSEANKVQLYGPYVKYNVLKSPYSLGRYQFELSDVRLEVSQEELETVPTASEDATEGALPSPTEDSGEEGESTGLTGEDLKESAVEGEPATIEPKAEENAAPNEREPQSRQFIYAVWPRFLMEFGTLQLIDQKNRVLLQEKFSGQQIGSDQKYSRYALEDSSSSLLAALQSPFQMCVTQVFQGSKVVACSNWLKYDGTKFVASFDGTNASSVLFNGGKVPKNSQVSTAPDQKRIRLEVKFKSGFRIYVSDKVHRLKLENVVIDPMEKRLGIVDGTGSVRPTELTTKDRFFSFIKEKNYFKNEYQSSKDWPEDLEDAEMEFAPYRIGASIQLYGLILPRVPPPFDFKLNEKNPIATYSQTVKLTGTKKPGEVLAARQTNELFIHNSDEEFLWQFPAPNKGELNKNYLSLQHKNKDYYFSQRIFRAHQTSVSANAALSTSRTLDIVPGYNFSLEHWFEEFWNDNRFSFQRWGVSGNIYETIQGFKPSDNAPEKISILPANIDLLYRFHPGVRPVQSSFGAGVRYMRFRLFRSVSSDIETQYLGVGGFWHTAPQKIVDDIFNIVPWFRYPKWMELSFFYYPMLIGPQQLGFSFSWQAKGKMFFSRQWFLEASFNVNNFAFNQPVVRGVTPGFETFGIGTAHGTVGLGYLFF